MLAIHTKIFAHRGASRYAPENTMSAFQLAHKQGAGGIELDIHLSRDNEIVVIHDETLKRTTNHSGLVNHFTLQELQALDAGSWFHQDFSQAVIPSLEQVLNWVKTTDLHLNIELKTDTIPYHQIEDRVVELIEHFRLEDRTILSCFNPSTIHHLHSIQNHIELAWLRQKRTKNLAYQLGAIGADSVHIHQRLLGGPMTHEIQTKQIPFRVFTVNKAKQWKQCLNLHANGLITDIPDLMKE